MENHVKHMTKPKTKTKTKTRKHSTKSKSKSVSNQCKVPHVLASFEKGFEKTFKTTTKKENANVERSLVKLFKTPFAPSKVTAKNDYYDYINYQWIANKSK
jgi:hypothetical protein